MTQPDLLGSGLGLRGRITLISWLHGQVLLWRSWNIRPRECENSRYPKHCIWPLSPGNTLANTR
jgi:hypothetical protein